MARLRARVARARALLRGLAPGINVFVGHLRRSKEHLDGPAAPVELLERPDLRAASGTHKTRLGFAGPSGLGWALQSRCAQVPGRPSIHAIVRLGGGL